MQDLSTKIRRLLFQTGGHRCRHFSLRKVSGKSSCCNSRLSEDYGPVCKLTGGLCPGLAQCPRLGLEEKSRLIELWRKDVALKVQIDYKPFLEN